MADTKQALQVTVEDGRLVVSIGIDTLAHAYNCSEMDGEIVDAEGFATDVRTAMLATEPTHDTASRVECFIDDCMEAASEFSLGVVFDYEPESEEAPPDA